MHSVVHSSSAPAKLDKLASQEDATNSEEASQRTGRITDSNCSESGSKNRILSVPCGASGNEIKQEDFEDDVVLSKRIENEDNTECSSALGVETSQISGDQICESEMTIDKQPDETTDKNSLKGNCENSKSFCNTQETSSEGFEDSKQQRVENEASIKTVGTDEQGAVSSEINSSSNQSNSCDIDQNIEEDETFEKPGQSETNTERGFMARLIEGGRKISSANSSPRPTRKQELSNKTSNELSKESETNSSMAANLKKNFKNRFADISISFRKTDDSVNASEIQWNDSEDNAEPPRMDGTGRRNLLAAAQERGRAFIPELRNKFSGLSNRSPRLERKTDWEKVINESGCRTKIIQI
jgi:hypothetical protein